MRSNAVITKEVVNDAFPIEDIEQVFHLVDFLFVLGGFQSHRHLKGLIW